MKRYLTLFLFQIVGVAHLVAQCPGSAISSSKTDYCISDFVELTASNVPTSTLVEWNIGQGWDTAGVNYIVPAPATGTMTIALRLTLGNGTICDYKEDNLVTIHALPSPDFSLSRSLLCKVPDTLVITDKTPKSYKRNWVINSDILEGTPASFVHRINKTGNYNITLVAQDTNGCRNAVTRNTAIRAYEDINLNFVNSSNKHCYPVTTDFNSTFTLSNQSVKAYSWALAGSDKDGVSTKDVSGAVYAKPGVYNAILTVTTNEGCVYKKDRRSLMRIGDKGSMAVSVSKGQACLSERISINETKKPSPGRLVWNINAAEKTYPNPYQADLIFKDTGSFDLSLIYDYNGCISELNVKDIVQIQGLKADFISDNAWHCESPHTVDLVNTSDTSSGKISSFSWQVIDSATGSLITSATSKDFSFKISTAPAVYHIRLITRSSAGCNDTTTKESFARVLPYRFDFFADPNVACSGQSIDFINKTPSGSYYGLDLFSWDFYNKDKSKVLGSSGSLSPSFNYPDTGYYPVQLTAANPLGCQEKFVLDSAVHIVLPELDYNWQDSVVCLNDSLQLIGKSYPVDERFLNNYKFRHLKSGQVFAFSGDTVSASLPEIGEYEVVYNYSIDGGCNDSIINKVWVNGLKGAIELDTSSGCTPLVIKPKFEVDYNVHVGYNDGDLSYYWDVIPRVGAVIQGATTAKPVFTLSQDREYRISLYVSNSSGCVNYILSKPINTGVKAEMTMSRKLGCIGDTIVLKDWSTNNPTSIAWEVDRPSGYVLDSVDPATSYFILGDTGEFEIRMIARKAGLCADTAKGIVGVTKLLADFKALDTAFKCAPATVRFTNRSVNADSLFWYFDDGDSLKQSIKDTITHQYKINSGPSGFDVMLVAKSDFGCTDTLVKKGAIKLQGPVGEFSMWNHKGCEPVGARFSNLSSGYAAFYFDYGDGSPVDTNKIATKHTYLNTDTNTGQYFEPKLTVVDSDGCMETFTHSERVEVYNYPEVGLRILPDTLVCQRQKVAISDTGRYTDYWFYYLNGDQVSTKRSDTILITEEGVNELYLLAQNKYGCIDTVRQNIRTRESAEMTFILPPYLCEKTPITAKLSVANKTKPFRYIWDFGESGNPDNFQTTSDSSATITYQQPGKKIIWVTAELPNGCSIPDSIHVNVFDSDNTPVMELDYATYDENNQVRLYYEDFDFEYLDFFNVYRDGTFLNKQNKNTGLNMLDPNPDKTFKHCYSTSITDQCGVEGGKGRSHCPVILKVASPGVEKVQLDWTYYVGWDRVDRYEIYRRDKKNTNDTFSKVGEVFSTQRSFLDSFELCNREYEYKVAAIRDGDETMSFSNTEIIEPQFVLYVNAFDVQNVTVLLDQTVHIRWNESTHEENDHYKLRKYRNDPGNFIEDFDITGTYFIDTNVNPSETSYLYTVAEVDRCNNIAQTRNFGKTILLKTWYENDQSFLKWESYEQWDHPIVEHQVEFVQPGNPVQIAQLTGNDLDYVDYNLYQDVNGYFPYRVCAINSNGDTSHSNISKTSGDAVFIMPNSFSPNNDGTNDRLGLFTLFITDSRPDDFVITFYNRWGEEVYQSRDIDMLWDGTSNGELLPPGIYVYNMRLTEGSGRQIHTSGTVHLMR